MYYLFLIKKGLWTTYRPLPINSKNPGVPKGIVIGKVLGQPGVTATDQLSQRIALIWVCKCLPRIFSDAPKEYLEKQFSDDNKGTFLLEPILPEEYEERAKTVPPVPPEFKDQLRRELRDEIIGRKSAHQLVDLQKNTRVGVKRTITSPNLKESPPVKKKRTSVPKSETFVVDQGNVLSEASQSTFQPSESLGSLSALPFNTTSFKDLAAGLNLTPSLNPIPTSTTPGTTTPEDSQPQLASVVVQTTDDLRTLVLSLQNELAELKQTIQRKERISQLDLLNLRSEVNLLRAQIEASE